MIWTQLGYVAIGWLCGSILFSYHLPLWLKGIDIVKDSADHNPGTFNAIKLAGVPIGMTCLVCDLAKGFIPVFLATRRIGPMFLLLPLLLAAPVVGHAYTPWYPFKGGKAIATSFGVLAGLLPFSYAVWVLVFWYLFFSVVLVIHPNEKRSVITFLCFVVTCAAGALITGHTAMSLGCTLMSFPPIVKNRIGWRQPPEKQDVNERRPLIE